MVGQTWWPLFGICYTDYYLWGSDWSKLLGWLADWNLLQSHISSFPLPSYGLLYRHRSFLNFLFWTSIALYMHRSFFNPSSSGVPQHSICIVRTLTFSLSKLYPSHSFIFASFVLRIHSAFESKNNVPWNCLFASGTRLIGRFVLLVWEYFDLLGVPILLVCRLEVLIRSGLGEGLGFIWT